VHIDAQPTVFVTGASGLVGSALVRQLLAQDISVKALYHQNTSPLLSKEEKKKVEWIQGDILDTSLLMDILPNCHQVYHCAAFVSFHPSRKNLMYRINVEGTANVVNASLECGIEKLVHVSSVAAIGESTDGEKITEQTERKEDDHGSHYGKTKYLSELEVWRGIGEGLSAVIVNPAIILGEGNWHHGSSAIFKKVWEEFPFYTTGATGFVDAADVAKAMIMLMNSNIASERFIMAAEHYTYEQLMKKIATIFRKKAPSQKAPKFLLELGWRWEAIKSIFSNKEPLITKETVGKAFMQRAYDGSKLIQSLPEFHYTPLDISLQRTCNWLMKAYGG
jgi:nucleoside-diphosphate-sugar epimerase